LSHRDGFYPETNIPRGAPGAARSGRLIGMPKRLVVCLDGTWNSPDNGCPTNVAKIMLAIAPVDEQGVPQITFYDAGIGADGGRIDRLLDGVTGRGLEQNVRDGYRFLANNWLPGDQIYLFGFSRGAYTARSLCGFLDLIGLLPKAELDRLDEAWALYRQPKPRRDEAKRRALRALSRPVRVRCLGVWDTVGALGVPVEALKWANRKYQFHNAELSTLVDCAFHALAIDEKRGPFGPVLWQKPRGARPSQVVEQVWFPGVHSNVGGGWPDSSISDLALTWMIRRVQASSELSFDEDYIAKHFRPDPLGGIYDSRTLPYTMSRVFPYQRLLGQNAVRSSGLRRLLNRVKGGDLRANRPHEGGEFVNEMIHWSALERFGQIAPQDGELRRYQPANLKVAIGRLPVADERRVLVEERLEAAAAAHASA
jgi:uncharacterized protein (DUF2235 family)